MITRQLLAILLAGCLTHTGIAAGSEQAVNELIPKLADENIANRYVAQMELQDLASNASKPGHESERAALGRVLAAKAAAASVPLAARVWIVRQLEYMGRGEAVPALTELLNGENAELRECARRALEQNPDPQAAVSLREALGKAAGQGPQANRWKIGLIHSLGEKGDPSAVRLIVAGLADAEAADAAAAALGKIASPDAIDALLQVVRQNPAAGDALIDAADGKLARKDESAAKEIFRHLYQEGESSALRAAALWGLVKTEPARAPALVAEGLRSNQPRLQQAAIVAAMDAGVTDMSQMLAGLLPTLEPSAKAQVLAILPRAAEPRIIEAVADEDEGVRRAALEALGRVGTAASVPVLIEAATDEGKPGKSAAQAALTRLSGEGALAAIERAAGAGEPRARAAAIAALVARTHVAVLPAMLKYAAESDATVRAAAFAALRQMGGDTEIEPLARMALAGETEAVGVLEAVVGRAKDPPAAATKLLGLAGDDTQALTALLGPLSLLGGDEALAAVRRLAAGSEGAAQTEAVRALGNWTDFGAVKILLPLAADKTTPLNQYQPAMQGLVRLIRSSVDEPSSARAEAALAALAAVRRDEDKKMVISVLGAVPDAKVADALKSLLTDPKVRNEAGVAGVALAELMVKTDPSTARDLAKAVKAADLGPDIDRRADRVLRR